MREAATMAGTEPMAGSSVARAILADPVATVAELVARAVERAERAAERADVPPGSSRLAQDHSTYIQRWSTC